MRKSAPIHIIVYAPKTVDGQNELVKRVAQVHADAVTQRMKNLNCPTGQKLQLLDAVIETARQQSAAPKESDLLDGNMER